MAQDYTTDCFSTAHVIETDMQNVEDNFEAIRTLFSGSSAPASPVAYQLWADSGTSVIKVRTTNSSWHTVFDVGQDCVAAGKVKTTSIAAGAVTSACIATAAVDSSHLASSAVTAAKLADGAVTGPKLANYTTGTDFIFHYGYALFYGNSTYSPICAAVLPAPGRITYKVYKPGGVGAGGIYVYRNSSLVVSVGTSGWTQGDLDLISSGMSVISIQGLGTGTGSAGTYFYAQILGGSGCAVIQNSAYGYVGVYGSSA